MKKILLFFIFLFFIIGNVNSVNINITSSPTGGPVIAPTEPIAIYSSDQSCITQINTALNLNLVTPILCTSYPNNFTCDNNGYIVQINIYGDGQKFVNAAGLVDYGSLRCFTHSPFPNLYLNGINLDDTFYNGTALTLSDIVLDQCSLLSINTNITSLNNSLTIYPRPIAAQLNYDIFNFVNLKKLSFFNKYKYSTSEWNISFKNSTGVQTNKFELLQLEFSFMPYLSNIKAKRVELYLNNFGSDDFMTYGYNGIEELLLNSSSTFPNNLFNFPIGIFTMQNSIFKKIETFFLFENENLNLNFSNHKYLETITINSPGTYLYSPSLRLVDLGKTKSLNLINTNILQGSSFSFLSKLTSYSFINGSYPSLYNINNFLNGFNYLKNLTIINSTGFSGNLADGFCNFFDLKLVNLGLNNTLPSCIYCYLNDTNTNFLKNNFTNYNPTNGYQIQKCQSIVPNLRNINGKTYLYGHDLGFTTDSFFTTPFYQFNIDVPSISFYTNQTINGLINVTFTIPEQTFILDADHKKPNIISVTVSNDSLGYFTFENSYFSYNISEISITIGNNICNVINSTFNEITCQISTYNPQIANADTIITIGNQVETIPVTTTPGLVNKYLTCSTNCTTNGGSVCNRNTGQCICVCNGNGTCNYLTQQCECNSLYQGPYCLIPNTTISNTAQIILNDTTTQVTINGWFGAIHNDLSIVIGENICNPIIISNFFITCNVVFIASPNYYNITVTQNGITKTNPNFFLYLYNNCPSNCIDSSHGTCNYAKGTCECINDYGGTTCEFKYHYVSSVIPTTINGGQVVIYGDFTQFHNNLQVLIGTELCNVTNYNDTTILCDIGSGTGTKSLTVNQNGLTWTSKNYYYFINPTKTCPSGCTSTSQGTCNTNTGVCVCSEKWTGFDCNSPVVIDQGSKDIPKSVPTVDTDTGVTQIQNQDVQFSISIIKLLEIDILSGDSIKEYTLKQTWDSSTTQTTSDGNNLYIFNQTLNQISSSTIVYKIENVKKEKTIDFAGLEFDIPSDAIKITIEINNYPFSSALNVLQLQMQSTVENDNTASPNTCNENESKSNNIEDESISYVKIEQNNKILYGRFINKIMCDNRATFISSSIVSNSSNSVIIGLNLPHCIESSVIDPDFSVLISPNYKTTCENSSKSKTVIIVAVVVPCVAVVGIIIGASIIYRKNRLSIKLKTMKLRRFN